MLVLSRKLGEKVIIGDNIRISVLTIEGNRVRLGLSAPKEVAIQREELLHRSEQVAPPAPEPGPAAGCV